jgi:hypothetical protein
MRSRPLALVTFGEREERGGDGPRGVDHRLQVRVVEIERVRGDAVHQRGACHVHLLGAAEDARLRRGVEHAHAPQRGFRGLVARRADGAAHPVQERAVRFVLDGVVPAAGGMRGNELREDRRDGRRVEVCRDLCVAGHFVFREGIS